MNSKSTLSLSGEWYIDYLSEAPYRGEDEPNFKMPEPTCENGEYLTPCRVPGYWEDMLDEFRKTPLHTKLAWNPLYTLQRYPQAGYCPDMALPNPVGCFVYRRELEIDEIPEGRQELYFGGVQNTASAWINGVFLGRHEGYSSSFSFPIPEGALKLGNNKLTLTVSNNRLEGYMGRPVSGLTSRAANECTGGIYGDVEIRFMKDGLRDLWVTTERDCSLFTVHTEGAEDVQKTVWITDGKKCLYTVIIPEGEDSVAIPSEGFKLWTPSEPKLYTVYCQTEGQRLENRFGIRRLTAEGTRLMLNGEPYYFRGITEHCYHPITVHPTRDKNYYRKVVRTLKSLGFNSIRFHTYVPMEEYMAAADELGIIIEIETPNNTTFEEWCDIVRMARHYTSPVMYSSGNEMVIDEDYIEHLRACADMVHRESDSLFSPMSAMRGIEYHSYGDCEVDEPFPHNPKRLAALGEFSDLYNSYSLGLTSYNSDQGDPALLDYRNSIYGKPLLTHEICINGTYIDFGLQYRYEGSRIGETEFMSSCAKHLKEKGLMHRAPIYYKNSAAWQQLLRKNCFEVCRRTNSFAGYDFLGDIDTHWHTFGYCVGMMNEFYELKPGETVENVLRYNSDRVLLADLPRCRNFAAGARLSLPLLLSNYGKPIKGATLTVRLYSGDRTYYRRIVRTAEIEAGCISELFNAELVLPRVDTPTELRLKVTLSGDGADAENEWRLYAYPKEKLPSQKELKAKGVTVLEECSGAELMQRMKNGEKVVLLGAGPFASVETKFQLSVAGRTFGHLATVINEHPITNRLAHEGFCGWQFREMLSDGRSVVLDIPSMPFEPVIEIASTYKNARREALLFEYKIGCGSLLVCSLNLSASDAGAHWLKAAILQYAASDEFCPKDAISYATLATLCEASPIVEESNSNEAANKNDITMN